MTQFSNVVPELDGAPLEAIVSDTWTPLHGVRYKTNLSAAKSILLDPTRPVGFWFEIQEYSRLQWTTNNLTIDRNGQNINDNAGNFVCNVGGQTLRVSKKAVGEWEVSAVAILSVNPDTALVRLQTIEAVNAASIDFTNFVDTDTYIDYEIAVAQLRPSAAAQLTGRISTDNGASWGTSAVYETHIIYGYPQTSTVFHNTYTSQNLWHMTAGTVGDNFADKSGYNHRITLENFGFNTRPGVTTVGKYGDGTPTLIGQRSHHTYMGILTANAFQLFFSGTNVTATCTLYGRRK